MHPATPHVSGMRGWFFARELAKRGHRVVQICEWREGTVVAPPPAQLAGLLKTHDWADPLVLAIKPKPRQLLKVIRSARTPALLRKALVLGTYLCHSGMFPDFSQAVQPYLPELAREFQPHATWGLFGNTDCWLIAQRLARLSDCSWLADMKDSWDVFIPRTLRFALAQRFQDMAACTANAHFNADVLQRYFKPKPLVLYSGVDASFLTPVCLATEHVGFQLTITGSVHNLELLTRLVEALQAWFSSSQGPGMSGATTSEVIYAGASAKQVEPILRLLSPVAKVTVHGFLPLSELAALCQSANVNAYIWNSKTFHHKLLELLSCGRPVIAFPGETNESKRLASECGGQLEVTRDQSELIAVLNKFTQMPQPDFGSGIQKHDFSWPAQARRLEHLLIKASSDAKR